MGQTLIVSVVYIQPPQKCGAKDLFQEIIEYLKFKATKGTVSDFRGRTMEVLKGCRVEMIIIDEANRIKPETFAQMAKSQNLLLINFNSLFWIERFLRSASLSLFLSNSTIVVKGCFLLQTK